MLRSYLRVATRNLLKNKLATFIHTLGFSVAIGCCIVLFLVIDDSRKIDTFHEHAAEIYRVENRVTEQGAEKSTFETPLPLAATLKAELPAVSHATRIASRLGVVRAGGKIIQERIYFVDTDFLDMFTFPLKNGPESAFKGRDEVIVSEEVARRYFGEERPLGKSMAITFESKRPKSYIVKAVLQELPQTSSMRFDILVNFETQPSLGLSSSNDWTQLVPSTYVRLADVKHTRDTIIEMTRYRDIYNSLNPDRKIDQFDLVQLVDVSKCSMDSNRQAFLLSLLIIFLLALPSINYINIAIASCVARMNEIALRKTIGVRKGQLVSQFLLENVMLCTLSLIVGVAICELFLLPGYNALAGESHTLSLLNNIEIWLFLAGLLLLVGVGAGAYPAFYISSFQPVRIFRGTHEFGRSSRFMRSLHVTQYVLSFIAIIVTVTFAQNDAYQRGLDWGYDPQNVLVVRLNDAKHFKLLSNRIIARPEFLSVAGSANHIGRNSEKVTVTVDELRYEILQFEIGLGYFETLELSLIEGDLAGLDNDKSIIVNETFVHRLGWQQAIGKQVTLNHEILQVTGVVKDFHTTHVSKPIPPLMLRQTSEQAFRFLVTKVVPGSAQRMLTYVEQSLAELFPGSPREIFAQDRIFDGRYQDMDNAQTVFNFTASFVLLIACMGLFGLVAVDASRRVKEVGIRKVFGATISNIFTLTTARYLKLLCVASTIGIGLSLVLLPAMLKGGFAHSMPLGPSPFVLTAFIIFLTATATVLAYVYKTAIANPAEVLRYE